MEFVIKNLSFIAVLLLLNIGLIAPPYSYRANFILSLTILKLLARKASIFTKLGIP
jgi:hypothetical protein